MKGMMSMVTIVGVIVAGSHAVAQQAASVLPIFQDYVTPPLRNSMGSPELPTQLPCSASKGLSSNRPWIR